jgi:hypothetical protein
LRAIHNLHETFARNLGASLSAYLRAYLTASIVSVKQLSYHEFSAGLASPTCLLSLGLQPYEGNAVMELNPSLIFPMIELLLGGGGRQPVTLQREITEIELKLLQSCSGSCSRTSRERLEKCRNLGIRRRSSGDGDPIVPGAGAAGSRSGDRDRNADRRGVGNDEPCHSERHSQDDASKI